MKKVNTERQLITITNPKSTISEAFRTLRTNIQFASLDKDIRTLMVTSSGPAEGKSTTIANLAIVMAQSEKRVLLVDADMRKPTVHHIFRVSNRAGLTNVLIGQFSLEEMVRPTLVDGLDILTSGPIPPNPSELLASKRMSMLMSEMMDQYDMVLFDTPPVIAVTDAQILASQVDGVLLVVFYGKTPKEAALKAKNQLDNVKAKLLGVVLNNKQIKGDNYYYYYYGETKR